MSSHTFVVPAYGQSRYLDDCLASLAAQSSGSRVVVCTSTPFAGLAAIAARHGAELAVHAPNRGIGHDWNMALAQSRSTWTTLAHQDDLYHPDYARAMVAAGSVQRRPLIVFSDYAERCGERTSTAGALLRIKRVLLALGFTGRGAIESRRAKQRALRFGSPIPCPAVTFHRAALEAFRFREDLRVSLDWAAWLELAERPGAFVRVPRVLMQHRLHESSETAAGLQDGTRRREDFELLCSLWTPGLARLILAAYGGAYAIGQATARAR